MLATLFYLITFMGLIGLFFISLGRTFPKKWMNRAPFALFPVGILGSFFMHQANISTWLTWVSAVALGIYIALKRPGLFSMKILKSGVSLALIFVSLVVLEMPSHYLLPGAGQLTIFEKLLFTLLTFSSTFSFISQMPLRIKAPISLPLTSLIVRGLDLLILSISLLFLVTESPMGLIFLSGLTIALTAFIRFFLLSTATNTQLFDRMSGYVFAIQFVFLALLLNYVPLFLVAGVMMVQNLPTITDLIRIKETFLWPKK